MKSLTLFFGILLLSAAGFGQTVEPTPAPTPLPRKSPEIEAQEIARQKKSLQKQPTNLSWQLFTKNDNAEHINLFLISYRFADRKIPPTMEVCFDYTEKFPEKPNFEEGRIFSLYLYIDGNFVMFPLPEKDEMPVRWTDENTDFYRQTHHFRVSLTDEEAIALGKAEHISVKWNKGSFEIGSEGFAAIKKFYDEEMPKDK